MNMKGKSLFNPCFLQLLLLLLLLCFTGLGTCALPPKIFDVLDYGAVADGNTTDNSQAFLKTWRMACAYPGDSTVLIRRGKYLVKKVSFEGPCRGSLTFLNQATLRAPITSFFTDTWIAFRQVDNLLVTGGIYNGRGRFAWPYNNCKKNAAHCNKNLPATLRFDFIRNSRVEALRSINSKKVHINIFACENFKLNRILISAPAESPNTDGILIGGSQFVTISQSVISTGDDCIAMVSGSENIHISDVTCGPGHGISIGSLGRSSTDEYVKNVVVKDCRFIATDNGVRIKTWPQLSHRSMASNITFENILMQATGNPIIIDQQYCPDNSCSMDQSSGVQIEDVTFKNIWGISISEVAVKLHCSSSVPCKNIKLIDINLAYNGLKGRAVSQCVNVIGSASGMIFPSGCDL